MCSRIRWFCGNAQNTWIFIRLSFEVRAHAQKNSWTCTLKNTTVCTILLFIIDIEGVTLLRWFVRMRRKREISFYCISKFVRMRRRLCRYVQARNHQVVILSGMFSLSTGNFCLCKFRIWVSKCVNMSKKLDMSTLERNICSVVNSRYRLIDCIVCIYANDSF